MSDSLVTNSSDARRRSAASRRDFLVAAGAAGLSLVWRRAQAASEAVPPPHFLLQWGRPGHGDGEFSACVGVAIGKDDVVYTSEFRNHRVQRFTTEGKFLGGFAIQSFAGGLAVGADGTVYVGHWNSNKVAAYSASGRLLRDWGKKGTADGEFQLPGSVALGPDGLLYVPDQGNSRVQKFTTEGRFVGKFGKHGSEPGEFGGSQPVGGRFAGPQFVAFDRAGNVYTTDAALGRVQKFTPEGKLLAHWGSKSDGPGGFGGPPPVGKNGVAGLGGPIALCVDREDRVWVSGTNNKVQQFTNAGKFLRSVGNRGEGPGQFHTPHGLALDSRECLYVADTMNSRIQKFATR